MMFKVEFEFITTEGDWMLTSLDNNGKGYNEEDADSIGRDLCCRWGIRNVRLMEV